MSEMRRLLRIVESGMEASGLSSELQQLIRQAEDQGMRLRVSLANSRTLNLDLIERRAAPKGSGADAMRALCALADKYRMKITTYAYEANPDLIGYYERFGFQEDPRAGDEAALIRKPSPSNRKK